MSDIDDTDTDLDTADRGNDLPDTEQPRDAEGRFAPKGETAAPAAAPAADEDEAEDEDEDEDEGEDEGEDEDEDEGRGKPDSKNYAVRYHKARDKLTKVEARLQELEAQLRASPAAPAQPAAKDTEAPKDPIADIESQLDALYEQVENARADGDTKLAASLQRQIDRGNVQIAEIKAARIAQATASRSSESARFNALLDVAEAMIPAVNPESAEYSQDKTSALEAMVIGYERQGLSPSDALTRAVNAMFDVDLTKPRAKSEAAAPPAPKAKPEPKKPDAKKAVETAAKQPPAADGMGVNKDDSKLRIADLSDEEFDKLPEATKARYRGDSLAA